jgi:hypothetical protein
MPLKLRRQILSARFFSVVKKCTPDIKIGCFVNSHLHTQNAEKHRMSVCDVSASKKRETNLIRSFWLLAAAAHSARPFGRSRPLRPHVRPAIAQSASSSDAQTQINARFHSRISSPRHTKWPFARHFPHFLHFTTKFRELSFLNAPIVWHIG